MDEENQNLWYNGLGEQTDLFQAFLAGAIVDDSK